MRLRFALTLGVLLLALTAAPASAQWFVTPYAGGNFGGDTDDAKFNLGAGVGFLGGGIFGFEVDLGFAPDFFETDDSIDFDSEANLASLMANVIVIAPPTLAFRPYWSGGGGWIRTHLRDADDFFTTSNDDFGFNVGAGFMAQFNEHVGWRTDVRYFRALIDNEEDNEFDVAVGDFDFWRGAVGVTFTF